MTGEDLSGLKIAVSWAYAPSYAKPLSVPQGLITLMTRFGMHVALAHPPGYDLVDRTIQAARANAEKSGGSLSLSRLARMNRCASRILAVSRGEHLRTLMPASARPAASRPTVTKPKNRERNIPIRFALGLPSRLGADFAA